MSVGAKRTCGRVEVKKSVVVLKWKTGLPQWMDICGYTVVIDAVIYHQIASDLW